MPSSDLKGTCSLYNELVMGPDSGYSVSNEQKVKELLKKVKKLFNIPHWTSTYSKLSLSKLLSEQSLPQRRQILGKIFLFLTLTYELRDICNITLSLYAFEYMTGYLSMIATNFPMGNNPLPEPISFSTDYFRKECLEQIESLDVRTVDDSRAIELYLKFNFLLRREFWYRDYFDQVQISDSTEKIEIDDHSWTLITNDLYGIEHIIHLEEERYDNPKPNFRQPRRKHSKLPKH